MSYVTSVGHRVTGCEAHTSHNLSSRRLSWPGQAMAYGLFLVVDTHLYSVYQDPYSATEATRHYEYLDDNTCEWTCVAGS